MQTRETHCCKPESTHGVQDGRKKKPRPADWVQTKCCFGVGCWYKHRCFNTHDDCDYEEWDEESELKCQLILLEAKKKVARQRAKLLRKPLGPVPSNSPRAENTGDEKKGERSKGAPRQQRKSREERANNYRDMKARREEEAAQEEKAKGNNTDRVGDIHPHRVLSPQGDEPWNEAIVVSYARGEIRDMRTPPEGTVEWKFVDALRRGILTDDDLFACAQYYDRRVDKDTNRSVVVNTALIAYQTGKAII